MSEDEAEMSKRVGDVSDSEEADIATINTDEKNQEKTLSKKQDSNKKKKRILKAKQKVKKIKQPKHKKPLRNKKLIILVISLIIVCVMFIGVFFYLFFNYNPSKQIDKKAFKLSLSESKEGFLADHKDRIESIDSNALLDQSLKKMAKLRDNLLNKQKAIIGIRQTIKDKIERIENDIIKIVHNQKINSFKKALANRQIELDLMTIHRRQLYIKELDQLFNQLLDDSEKLLFMERHIKIQRKMVDYLKNINFDMLIKLIKKTIQAHLIHENKFTMDLKNETSSQLKLIWAKVDHKMKATRNQKKKTSNEAMRNREIWQEIIDGNFDRKYQLTEISSIVAKHLSKWKGKDLFLPNIKILTSEEAKYLSYWKGEWLSLNNIKSLSTDVAKYLARWHGQRLSLNGLEKISPEVVKYLMQWPGKELELIGLKPIAKLNFSRKRIYFNKKINLK